MQGSEAATERSGGGLDPKMVVVERPGWGQSAGCHLCPWLSNQVVCGPLTEREG